MDPVLSLQDVIRCNVCDEPVSRLHENLYHIDLCKPCADKHLDKPNFPKCSKHVTNSCDNYCVQCSILLCMDCNSSGEHQEHKIVELRKHFENQRKILQRDLEEIQKHIYPIYQTAASEFLSHKIALSQNTKKLTRALYEQGEIWHKMIYTIIQNMLSEINDNDSKHFADLNRREEEVRCKISKISLVVTELEKLIESGDVSLVSEYQSKVSEFRNLPSQLKVTLPRFSSGTISTEQLNHHFGYLSKLSLATEKRMYKWKIHKEQPYSSGLSMLDLPHLITCFDMHKIFINVSCMSDEEIWTGGTDNIIRLYNLNGELLKSAQTKSGKWPRGIYVSATQKRDLMYADYEYGSINIVKNKETKQPIRKTG